MPGNKKNHRKERQKAKAAPKRVAAIGHVTAGAVGKSLAVMTAFHGIAETLNAERRSVPVLVSKIKLISGRDMVSAHRLYRRIAKISDRTRWSREDLVEEWVQRAYAREFPNPEAEAIRRAKLRAMG